MEKTIQPQLKPYVDWCAAHGLKPSDGRALQAYDIFRNFKPKGFFGR